MPIKRVPTAIERWFLALCKAEWKRCLSNKNTIGEHFWGHIGYLAHEEFYNKRRGA